MPLVNFSLVALLVLMAIPAQGQRISASNCLEGLVPRLVSGNFSGSVDCMGDRLSARFAGQIHSGGHQFAIYDYRYKLAPPCQECAVHGGQRVIILRDGYYIGQYKPDFARVEVTHNKLVLTTYYGPKLSDEHARSISIPFKADGPPWTIWDGDDTIAFFR